MLIEEVSSPLTESKERFLLLEFNPQGNHGPPSLKKFFQNSTASSEDPFPALPCCIPFGHLSMTWSRLLLGVRKLSEHFGQLSFSTECSHYIGITGRERLPLCICVCAHTMLFEPLPRGLVFCFKITTLKLLLLVLARQMLQVCTSFPQQHSNHLVGATFSRKMTGGESKTFCSPCPTHLYQSSLQTTAQQLHKSPEEDNGMSCHSSLREVSCWETAVCPWAFTVTNFSNFPHLVWE